MFDRVGTETWTALGSISGGSTPARAMKDQSPSICFVHTPCLELRDDRLEPPLGLLYLAARLRASGRAVTVVDLSSCEAHDLERRIPDGHDVYGFSTYTVNYGLTHRLASYVRTRNPDALFLAGGPHASALPDGVLADGFDVVVVGEGEVAIVEIVDALASGERLSGKMTGKPPESLDSLPFPAYELVDVSTYSREVDGRPCFSILSSRGCPYQCSFCNSTIMGAGRPIRFRHPENVVAEIRDLKSRYGVRHFRFQDDTFTIHRKRVLELAPYLAREDIVYRCFARINTCADHPEVVDALKESGCVHLSFGVETGSPKLLSLAAMHKSQTPDQIRRALVNAEARGLRTRIFLIVGFPGETDETIAETIDLVRSCPWHEFSVYPLIAYPGTPLHDRPGDFGITFIDTNYSDYLQIGRNFKAGFTIRTREFDEHRVRQWRDHVRDELLADGRTWAGDSPRFK